MEHPENLQDIKAVKVTEELKDTITTLQNEILEAKGKRSRWENRSDDYYRKRYGIRNKRNFPWPGYPNHILPLIDSDIQKAKPAYVNLAYGVSPVVTYEPFGPEDIEPARKREQLLDFRIKHKMDFFEPYVTGIDKMLQDGFTVFKIIWNFSSKKYTKFLNIEELPEEVVDTLYDEGTTDVMLKKILQEEFSVDLDFEENEETLDKTVAKFREGETNLELSLLEKEHNEPQLIVCDIKNDIVVPHDTTKINDARWIDYRYFSTVNDLKIAMRDGKYRKFKDEDIEGWAGKAPDHDKTSDRALREGVVTDNVSDEMVYLHETCLWYDIDGDGILERCIATYPDNSPTDILRFIELPYDHGMWPYVQVEREFVDTGFYSSRGIPALDDDFQTGISAAFNNDLANQVIVNTPQVIYRRNAVKNIRNIRYIPGEPIEVDDMNAYEIRQQVNASQGTFMVTQQQLKAWAQERIGNQSHGLTSPNNLPGSGQQGKKTAREIDEISSVTGQSQSLDMTVFQVQMKDVYYQIDSLYMQFGQEEEFIMTGEQPIKVSRREIQGKFNMTPNGKLSNSNPTLRAQQSFNTLMAFRGDPDVKQDELKKMYLQDIDLRAAKRLLFTAEEKAAIQQQSQQLAAQQKQQSIAEAIDFKRIGNAIDMEKEVALEQVHGKKFDEG